MSNMAIFDVNTQNQIMDDVDEKVLNNISSVLTVALKCGSVVTGSILIHPDGGRDDKMDNTILVDDESFYVCPNLGHGIDIDVASECWQIYFETYKPNVWDKTYGQPDNINTFFRSESIDTVVVVGSNVGNGIIKTIQGLSDTGYKVIVVIDAMTDISNHSILHDDDVRVMSTKEFSFECREVAKIVSGVQPESVITKALTDLREL